MILGTSQEVQLLIVYARCRTKNKKLKKSLRDGRNSWKCKEGMQPSVVKCTCKAITVEALLETDHNLLWIPQYKASRNSGQHLIGNRLALAYDSTLQLIANVVNSSPAQPTSRAKGMKLGRKGKSADLFEAIKTEVEEPLLRSPAPSAAAPVSTISQERYVITKTNIQTI